MINLPQKYFIILIIASFLSFLIGYSMREGNLFKEQISIGIGECKITFIGDKVEYKIANGETEKLAISEAFSAQPDLKTFQSLHETNLLNKSRLPFSCYYKDRKFVYGYTPGHFAAILKDFDYDSLKLIENKDSVFSGNEVLEYGTGDCYEDKDYRYILTELSSQNYMLEGKSITIKK